MVLIINNSLMLDKSKSVIIPFCLSKMNKPEQISIKLHSNMCKKGYITLCHLDCINITKVSEVKYLGVVFDEHVKWTSHICMITLQIRKCFYIFKDLRNILDIDNLKIIYLALV